VKQKDVVYLLIAVVIFLVAGYIGYSQLVPKKAASQTVTVEKVGVIPADLDSTGMSWINDTTHVKDYNLPEDLTGLGNTAPFGN
jgi:hypothetical protein